ncbi:MAG: carboxypeptidase-like regulatory domain-containing protein [Paludibacter sp.]
MRKILILLVVASLISLSAFAVEKASPEAKAEVQVPANTIVKGMVFDNLTNETLAGAVINANNQKIYTDLDGNFTLSNLCEGKCLINISMISYKDQTIELDLHNNQTLKIKLIQR